MQTSHTTTVTASDTLGLLRDAVLSYERETGIAVRRIAFCPGCGGLHVPIVADLRDQNGPADYRPWGDWHERCLERDRLRQRRRAARGLALPAEQGAEAAAAGGAGSAHEEIEREWARLRECLADAGCSFTPRLPGGVAGSAAGGG